jgi:hypothetical protein
MLVFFAEGPVRFVFYMPHRRSFWIKGLRDAVVAIEPYTPLEVCRQVVVFIRCRIRSSVQTVDTQDE